MLREFLNITARSMILSNSRWKTINADLRSEGAAPDLIKKPPFYDVRILEENRIFSGGSNGSGRNHFSAERDLSPKVSVSRLISAVHPSSEHRQH
jgi:hypothetical protein